jgi:hypothetical protein
MITNKVITFKIKKPKIINITNNNYKELTCFIFVAHQLNLNNKIKQLKLGLVKFFFNDMSFHILHGTYDSDIKSLFDIDIDTITRIYNRNCITIYVLNIDYSLQQITINNNVFSEKKFVLFLKKDEEENYGIIAKKTLNDSLNDILITPYFTIKLKYIISTIWNC